MKQVFMAAALLLLTTSDISQKRYFTKNGRISFSAGTSLEDIDAVNKTTTSVFDATTGQIEFSYW